VAPARRLEAVVVARPAVFGRVEPAAAPDHPGRASVEEISAPLPDIAMHVVKTQTVWLERPHPGRTRSLRPFLAVARGGAPVAARLVPEEIVAGSLAIEVVGTLFR